MTVKRRLFLHIGLSKTGTTSIQSFLRSNQAALAAHGVSYPDLAGERSTHPALAPSLLRPNPGQEVNHEALAMEIRSGGHAPSGKAVDTPLWSGVLARIDMADAHTAIISYENFYHRPELYRFDTLAESLARFQITGIIYLRPQEDWIVSLYSQTIKGTPRMRLPLDKFLTQRKMNLEYSTMLDSVKKHLPIDDLLIGDFERASSSGLLNDFIDKVGISHDLPLSTREQTVANRSMPYWATLFLRLCNQAQIPDATFIKVRRALAGMTPESAPDLRPGLDVATPEERQGLRAAAAGDADRLQERYGVTLARRIREPIAYRPFDKEDVEAIRRALAAKIPRSALEALDQA